MDIFATLSHHQFILKRFQEIQVVDILGVVVAVARFLRLEFEIRHNRLGTLPCQVLVVVLGRETSEALRCQACDA